MPINRSDLAMVDMVYNALAIATLVPRHRITGLKAVLQFMAEVEPEVMETLGDSEGATQVMSLLRSRREAMEAELGSLAAEIAEREADAKANARLFIDDIAKARAIEAAEERKAARKAKPAPKRARR